MINQIIKKHWVLLIAIVGYYCSPKKPIDNNISIIINNAQSYKWDLKKQTYTIFFVSKPPLEVKFSLSQSEKKTIISKYYELNLNNLGEKVEFNDECLSMPKLFTTLSIYAQSWSQQITIDESCNDFQDSKNAKNVKAFLEFVKGIIASKPEIKKLPRSDIMYL